jgi:squalene-hopene/tetraprenyl-beta-curcumene cyclase
MQQSVSSSAWPKDTEAEANRRLDSAIEAATAALIEARQPDGHWLFALEADATIPAEYVLFTQYLGEPGDAALEQKIGAYLRAHQADHGGWPLFHDGAFDVSASVKAYFALKMIGDDPDAVHMRRAREAILAHGGGASANVFTRFLLALYGILPWRAVPEMPVEIMLLPRWFPFHLSRVSYWARTVLVPLLVLQAVKPEARNPRGVRIDELFVQPPAQVGPRPRAPHQSRAWFAAFAAIDRALRLTQPLFPKRMRARAISRAVAFVTERLNGEDGLGGIFPAMVNAVMMYDCLGRGPDDPDRAIARASVDKLLLVDNAEAYCQPCLSPVWDTALACHALLETGDGGALPAVSQGLDWLVPRQELEVKGDWAVARPDVAPGGWAFQYANPHYPDLDDTAVIVMAMERTQRLTGGAPFQPEIARARTWIEGLQSRDGGWGAFDADNMDEYLNNIPFADHGALLDPPSPDLTGRCLSMLAQLGESPEAPAMQAGIAYLLRTQREDGSWFGRWGVNYIYGTWSALCALNAVGLEPSAPAVRRGGDWLIAIQNQDGGWGESGDSYRLDYAGHVPAPSTPSQTAWALLGLMAAGRADDAAAARGIEYLLSAQHQDGLWSEPFYTGTGFPRVFYLRYHGYPKYFPLWALSRFRRLKQTNSGKVPFGI